MTMLRTLRFGFLFSLIGTAVASCISPPDFPDTPSIEFKEMTVSRKPAPAGYVPQDTITIVVKFKDGDGDLGLNESEYTSPPYQRDGGGGTVNLNHYNYFCKLFVKNSNNVFVERTTRVNGAPFDPTGYYGQFPHLEPNPDKKAPLQGDLRFGVVFTLGDILLPDDEVRFEITIKDRALNTSNTVVTNSYKVTL